MTDESNIKQSLVQRSLVLVVISIMAYLSYLGYLSAWFRQVTGSNHIDATNVAYLASARDYTADLLAILTESKIVLAVLQSSQGGISFIVDVQVQLGQILSSLHDVINLSWQLTLASLSSIEFLSLLLEASHFSMSVMLTMFFISIGISVCFWKRYHKISQMVSKLTATLGLIVLVTHFILPYSIYSTAMLSKHLLSPHKSEIYRGYSSFHHQLPQHEGSSDLKDKVKGTMSYFKDKPEHLGKHSEKMSALSAKHLTLIFVEYLFMPLFIIYFFIRLTKQGLNSLLLDRK